MRTLAERVRDPVWWLEQAAHVGLGFAIGETIEQWVWPWLAGLLSALAGILREVIEGWGDEEGEWEEGAVDAGAWALGAILASLVA